MIAITVIMKIKIKILVTIIGEGKKRNGQKKKSMGVHVMSA